MRKIRETLLGETGQANCYHVISRVAGRGLVFGDAEKEFFRTLLAKQLKFSGLRCLAWCLAETVTGTCRKGKAMLRSWSTTVYPPKTIES